jgi:hypothetical protein
MSPWIYDHTPLPVARWGLANGEPSVFLDMPDDSNDVDPGTDDFDGETAIFQGADRGLALRWLRAALASVEALPAEPVWGDGEAMVRD